MPNISMQLSYQTRQEEDICAVSIRNVSSMSMTVRGDTKCKIRFVDVEQSGNSSNGCMQLIDQVLLIYSIKNCVHLINWIVFLLIKIWLYKYRNFTFKPIWFFTSVIVKSVNFHDFRLNKQNPKWEISVCEIASNLLYWVGLLPSNE